MPPSTEHIGFVCTVFGIQCFPVPHTLFTKYKYEFVRAKCQLNNKKKQKFTFMVFDSGFGYLSHSHCSQLVHTQLMEQIRICDVTLFFSIAFNKRGWSFSHKYAPINKLKNNQLNIISRSIIMCWQVIDLMCIVSCWFWKIECICHLSYQAEWNKLWQMFIAGCHIMN